VLIPQLVVSEQAWQRVAYRNRDQVAKAAPGPCAFCVVGASLKFHNNRAAQHF
jgi:hypothetical protein